MIFLCAVVVEGTVSLHADVTELIGHLVTVVLVEERQVSEHEIIILLLTCRNGVLHLVLVSHFRVDIHLRHRINLILNGNLTLLDSLLGWLVELVH